MGFQKTHMLWFKFFQRVHTEQLHGANHLCLHNLQGALNALLPTGHQAIEIGATDIGKVGTES